MRISVVTPVLNGGTLIESTIKSVINQKYEGLEYVIIDGGSTDNTLDVIRRYESEISCWITEPDDGIYDALNKGFRHTSGEIMCWLNAGDIYYPWTLLTVAKIINEHNFEWITGVPSSFADGAMTPMLSSIRLYPGYLIRAGLCHGRGYGFIPQESTFWSRSLWEKAGGFINLDYRYAGDYDLWRRMAHHSTLTTIATPLGAFCLHEGQLSKSSKEDYCREIYSQRGVLFRLASALLKRSHASGIYSILKKRSSLRR